LEKSRDSKDRGKNDEKEFPTEEVIVKLDILATARLSELSGKASLAEQSAITSLIGNVATSTIK